MEGCFTLRAENPRKQLPSTTVVIPTLNEEGNIGKLCTEIWQALKSEVEVTILVVDDLSTDGTVAEAERARGSGIPVQILRNDFRLGLGASIGRGITESQSDILAVMDADGTHAPDDLLDMVMLLARHDFVSGSRFALAGTDQGVPGYFSSRAYQKILRSVLRLPFVDILGGFWVTRRDKLERLQMGLIFYGYGDYYFRLLSELVHQSVGIHEFSATYRNRKFGKSKSKPLKMMFTYLFGAVRWRLVRHFRAGKRN